MRSVDGNNVGAETETGTIGSFVVGRSACSASPPSDHHPSDIIRTGPTARSSSDPAVLRRLPPRRRLPSASRVPPLHLGALLVSLLLRAPFSRLPFVASAARQRYAVEIPAFRLSLSPVPEDFGDAVAVRIFAAAEGVALDGLKRFARLTEELVGEEGKEEVCTSCTDIPSINMKKRGTDCQEATDAVEVRCYEDDYWVANGICQETCYSIGRGYDGLVCCEEEEEEDGDKEGDEDNVLKAKSVTFHYDGEFNYDGRRRQLGDIINRSVRDYYKDRNLRGQRRSRRRNQQDGTSVVLDSTYPAGGHVTFAADSVDDLPDQYALYVLLLESMKSLPEALSEALGYDDSVTSTLGVAFLFVDGPPERGASGKLVVATERPSDGPTAAPTDVTALESTAEPTRGPTDDPTGAPTDVTTLDPTAEPTKGPTHDPTASPTATDATDGPTVEPTSAFTETPPDAPLYGGTVGEASERAGETDEGPPSSGPALLAGAAVAAVAVVLLGALFVHRRRKNGKEYDTGDAGTVAASPGSSSGASAGLRYADGCAAFSFDDGEVGGADVSLCVNEDAVVDLVGSGADVVVRIAPTSMKNTKKKDSSLVADDVVGGSSALSPSSKRLPPIPASLMTALPPLDTCTEPDQCSSEFAPEVAPMNKEVLADETLDTSMSSSEPDDSETFGHLFAVTTPSAAEASQFSPPRRNPPKELVMVEPKIIASPEAPIVPGPTQGTESATILTTTLPPQITLERTTSLHKEVEFDAPDFEPDSSWDYQDNDAESNASSDLTSTNDPFVTPDRMRLNDEDGLLPSLPPPSPPVGFGSPESPGSRKAYRMERIHDSSFDYQYDEVSSAASLLSAALGRLDRKDRPRTSTDKAVSKDDTAHGWASRDWDDAVLL